MYIVSQITPFEWHKASNCDHKYVKYEDNCCIDDENENNIIFGSYRNPPLNSSNENGEENETIDPNVHQNSYYHHFYSEFENCEYNNEHLNQTHCGCDSLIDPRPDELKNIELISYENNFNLRNSFWWAIATLIQQTTTDLYPKVL